MDGGKFVAADDWTDQDLLIREEAKERLADEIDAERDAIGKLSASDPDPRVRAEV